MAKNKLIITAIILTLSTALAIPTQSLMQETFTQTSMTPGKTGYITVTLTNDGSDVAYSSKISLTSLDNPLTSDLLCTTCLEYSSTQDVCLNYPATCSITTGDVYGSTSKQYSYKINIPENTEPGYYQAKFLITYESKNFTTNQAITKRDTRNVIINVSSKTVKPDINLNKIILPETISPGDEFNLTIELENNGELNARDIKLSLSTTNFKIKDQTNKIALNDINPGNKTNITLKLLTDASLSPGVYDLQISLEYTDNEAIYTSTSNTGILVDGETKFNMFIQDITPDIITRDTTISALISVANTGVINAKSVSIKINPCSDVTLGNINEDFLGDLNTGDFTTTSFDFKPNKEGELKINLSIEYLTPSGKTVTFNKTETIIVNFKAQEIITSKPIINTLDIFLTIAVIILIIYIFKKSKSKK